MGITRSPAPEPMVFGDEPSGGTMLRSFRRALVGMAGLCLVVQLGCGTLLYPERHGNRSGRVDPGGLGESHLSDGG